MARRLVLTHLLLWGTLTTAHAAFADAPAPDFAEAKTVAPAPDPAEAKTFVQQQQSALMDLIRKQGAASAAVGTSMNDLLDYDELTRRSLGSPCPVEVPKCDDLWTALEPKQRDEVKSLLTQIIIKNYRQRLKDTLDYDVAYKEVKLVGRENKDAQVHTEVKARNNPRATASQLYYVVRRRADGSYKVVEIKPEGASMVRTYYDQFRTWMNNPDQKYPYLVRKLTEKLAKADSAKSP